MLIYFANKFKYDRKSEHKHSNPALSMTAGKTLDQKTRLSFALRETQLVS